MQYPRMEKENEEDLHDVEQIGLTWYWYLISWNLGLSAKVSTNDQLFLTRLESANPKAIEKKKLTVRTKSSGGLTVVG